MKYYLLNRRNKRSRMPGGSHDIANAWGFKMAASLWQTGKAKIFKKSICLNPFKILFQARI